MGRLVHIDPVTIGFGDGASDSYSFNGAFTHDFYHAYQSASEYAPVAHMPTDSGTFSGSVSQPVVVGGDRALLPVEEVEASLNLT